MVSKSSEITANPETLARRLAFLVAISALVYVDWTMGFTLLNSYSAGAFIIFMAVPILSLIHISEPTRPY